MPAGKTPETGAGPCGMIASGMLQSSGAQERCPVRTFKETTGYLSRAGTYSSVNMGSPKGRESYGDGVPVLVGGVTSAESGDRESRTTGRRGTGDERLRTMKDAQCRQLKWC